MPTKINIEKNKIDTMIRKSGKEWDVGYKGNDGMMYYITSAPTKDELIHKLARKVVKSCMQ